MDTIRRIECGPRMSQCVVHNGLVYLAGQVGTAKASVAEQTRTALAEVDRLLELAGSHKSRLLSVQIWLASIDDFDEMNGVYDEWVVPGQTPGRATGESVLASPDHQVEIIAVAAV